MKGGGEKKECDRLIKSLNLIYKQHIAALTKQLSQDLMPKIVCRLSIICVFTYVHVCIVQRTNGCEKINWKTKSSDILTAKD